MSERVPQITDDVHIELILPATTEEWADESLGREFAVVRDERDRLIVEQTVGGNTNAVSCVRSFLTEVEDFLFDADIDPMAFELRVTSSAPGTELPA